MPTLDIRDQADGTTDDYWRFTVYCMGIHDALHGPEHMDLSLRDIIREQLSLQGASLINDHRTLVFRSEQHRTMWEIRWST